ncbi:hypothetical protein [Clostridium magnum]|nr:hypothetical protein [Clostridium magnum]
MFKDFFAGAKGRNPDGIIPISNFDWDKIKINNMYSQIVKK